MNTRANTFALLLAVGASGLGLAADAPAVAPAAYDAALAQRLGADEYGMKSYVLVMLKTGAVTDLPKEKVAALFDGHMANIKRLANDGRLVVAGPLQKNEQHYRGIFIFNSTSVAETEALLKTDPAIAGGLLAYECYGWYGTAAMMEIMSIHRRIEQKSP